MKPLRLATRGSELALWQARAVAARLRALGHESELVVIKTTGDRLQHAPLAHHMEDGGKRLFVREIEDALLRREVDLAVHSAKDMPAALPDGLMIGAALPREDPHDALVLPNGRAVADLRAAVATLGDSPAIGTSSVRRIAQLATLLPRASFVPIRGNVDTRLRKLDQGGFDALVLAAAGMKRLGFGTRISAVIPPADCVPAPGQGIVAVEVREDAADLLGIMAALADAAASAALAAERAVVSALGGGCQLPLGAVAVPDGDQLDLHAVVSSLDGRRHVRRRGRGPFGAAAELGARVAADLQAGGAADILDEIRNAPGPVA